MAEVFGGQLSSADAGFRVLEWSAGMIRSFLILAGRSPCFDSPQGTRGFLSNARMAFASDSC